MRTITHLALTALLTSPFACALRASDIPHDTPVNELIKTASVQLAAGNAQDALTYFDVAITRDPLNYMTLFKRGAAYLSLGKPSQARRDFDKVLQLKPGHEGALVQRAKLRARQGEWTEAEADYAAAGKKKDAGEIAELHEAQGAAVAAASAAESGNWEACIQQSGTAIMVAAGDVSLRNLRAKCRFERGELAEGISDLQHILHMNPGSVEPHIKVSTLQFFGLGETEAGLAQIRRCLQSDPESKACKKVLRSEKGLDKQAKKVRSLMDKKQNVAATKVLVQNGAEPGLLQEVKDEFEAYKKEGVIHSDTPNGLYANLLESTCEAYVEMKNKKGDPYCAEALALNPTSLYGLISKARQHTAKEDYEAALSALGTAKDHHGANEKIQTLIHETQTLLKRSKQKDYYKVLGVPRDADARDIKKAMRREARKFHPDKAGAQGIGKEEAEKKMAAINEAYEVLSDPELRERFDRGDDPNDPTGGGQQPFQGSPFGGGGAHQFMFRQQGQRSGGGGFQFQQGGFPGGFPFG